ncbi:hypothetical protein GH714_021982 [Hevea brasiliensis]|uniref:Uncharacterized protein n=1 Tax=Hevea brasiliensis TaxID=3981 RepID=A0A6A6MC65_HEVBR|nr:hypothetical protein GH714_021982 [Hevea brasiliensis]
MKDQPIPEAIRGLLVQDPLVASVPGSDKINHFVNDFDTRPIAVIYQSGHGEFTKIGGTHGEDLRDDHEKKGKKSSAEHSTPVEQDGMIHPNLEKRKVPSNVEKAGLLSKAEELGSTLLSIENLGVFSRAEELGLLESVGEDSQCLPVDSGFSWASHTGSGAGSDRGERNNVECVRLRDVNFKDHDENDGEGGREAGGTFQDSNLVFMVDACWTEKVEILDRKGRDLSKAAI